MPRLTRIPTPNRARPSDGRDQWDLTCDGLPPDHDCTNIIGTLTFPADIRPSLHAFNGYLCESCAETKHAQEIEAAESATREEPS